jgi:hypothetical protein
MKKIVCVMVAIFIVLVITPVASCFKSTENNGYIITLFIEKIDRNDGCIVYNVTNFGEHIYNETIYIRFHGEAVKRNGHVDVNTSIFLDGIQQDSFQLIKTKDPIFTKKQFPIFHRPLLGIFEEVETWGSATQYGNVKILFYAIFEETYSG